MAIPETEQPSKAERWQWAKKAIFSLATSSLVWAALIAALFLFAVNFQPARFVGWVLGPTGKIYVSSPGVYTRERLVNDRNDQDFWLRDQLRLLDESPIGFSAVTLSDLRLKAEVAAMSGGGKGSGVPTAEEGAGGAGGGLPPPSTQPSLTFLDSFAIRAAARDSIRQSILENLLDDRHDLTGNSVYGLKFDTTVIPGRFTTGRAFVRLSITPDQAALVPDEPIPDKRFPDLPYHLRTYYQFDYSQIANDPDNLNHNSFTLYSQWRSNVGWRLNTHFLQIMESKCRCLQGGTGDNKTPCSLPPPDWRQEIVSTVNKVLAIDGAKIKAGQSLTTAADSSMGIILPAPWDHFLAVSVRMPKVSDCMNLPAFVVDQVVDSIYVRPKEGTDGEYKLIDWIDDKESAYVYVPKSEEADWLVYWPHYRNIRSIARYVKSIGKQPTYCADPTKKETCVGYINIPSGYFNFIEKVLKPDMYAYSLFPRLEATSILSAQTTSRSLGAKKAEGGASVGVDSLDSINEASLMPTAIGFTDAESEKSIDLGWIVDVGRNGAPFQRSQFALVSVPAWTSRLKVSVRTGWLDWNSAEGASEPQNYTVPIPPDFEAFDTFIGQESVRRPHISDEFMVDNVTLVACRQAAILIPGLRLWRSAMVTIGSEQADKITVLPNMRGIIAEFTKLNRSAATGDTTLRVWTSEGVDSQSGKIRVVLPDNPAECDERLATSPTLPAPPKVNASPAAVKPN